MPSRFEEHMDEAYQRLRSSLTAVVLSARGEVTFPQDLARHLKINRNLAWRVSKVMESSSPEGGVPHLPGAGGFRRLLDAARKSGTTDDLIARVEEAHANFLAMVELHAGDQETFELLLDSRASNDDRDVLAASRRMAFRGNSGITGVQARAKVTCCFLAPAKTDARRLDTLLVGGFVDVCRLRPVQGWALFRIRAYQRCGETEKTNLSDDLMVLHARKGVLAPFHESMCSDLISERDDRGLTLRLGAGRVGRTGMFSAYFGSPLDGVFDRYASAEDRTGEITSIVEVPVETLLFDMFIHRELGYGSGLDLSVVARPARGLDDHESPLTRTSLPISVKPERLSGGPERCVTPICPQYPEIIERASSGTGWNLEEFVCHRFIVAYPPLHSTVVVSFPLDEPPLGSLGTVG